MNTGVLRLFIFQGSKRPTRSQSRRATTAPHVDAWFLEKRCSYCMRKAGDCQQEMRGTDKNALRKSACNMSAEWGIL